jgi:hypothetical protein
MKPLIALGFLWVFVPHMLSCNKPVEPLPQKQFVTADPQEASGTWQIEVQLPPCDTDLEVIPPEREGDVLTVYCKTSPVKER